MRKPISHKQLTPLIGLSECHDGFWLYDKTRGMNLSMRAKTAECAFVDAIEYYQKRLLAVENELSVLKSRVEIFVDQFIEKDGHENDY